MIDKKLNSISNEYSNIVQDINLMKKMWAENGSMGGVNSNYLASLIVNLEDEDD
jgi:prolyl-tRNA synthetase